MTSLPSKLKPSLQLFSNASTSYKLTGPSFFAACDPYDSKKLSAHPVPCIFGDHLSKKTIVLVGDSNVGNWAPALSIGLKKDGYRLAVFGYSGCPASDIIYTASTSSQYQRCNRWHARVPAAIRALHPVAVIAASGPYDVAASPEDEWVAGFSKLFEDATAGSPAITRILFGTSPIFPESIPGCLAAHPDPQTCAIHFKIGDHHYGDYLSRDVSEASAAHAKLVVTYPWFCSDGTCSPVIGKYLVYTDKDHLSIAYSDYLSAVITNSVLNLLPHH
jgi:hypothetical protein